MLRPVSVRSTDDVAFLFQLLAERIPDQSISHKVMPTWPEHCLFVRAAPYLHWYIIGPEDRFGAIYLTRQREIGVSVLREHQRRGYARAAVEQLTALHPGRFLANVNPANTASIKLWESLGFKHIQNTYAKEGP